MHGRLLGELSTLVLTLLLGSLLLVACGGDTPDSTATVPASPTTGVARATLGGDVPGDVVDRAMAWVAEHVTILSGSPEVALSRRVVGDELNALGIGTWSFEPGCAVPIDVVIIRGELDVRETWAATSPVGTPAAARYLVLVYDARQSEPVAAFGDPTGGLVQQALHDQPVATPDFGLSPPNFPEPIPCDLDG